MAVATVHLALAVVCPALVCAAGSVGFAFRERAKARADRRALRQSRQSAASVAEAAFLLTAAARTSAAAVRAEVARALTAAVPAADGVLVYEECHGALSCIAAYGARFAYFIGSAVALDDASALPVLALRRGHHVLLFDDRMPSSLPRGERGESCARNPGDERGASRALHPGDESSVAVPLSLEPGRRCVLVVCAPCVLDRDDVQRILALARQCSPAYAIALDREQDRYDAEYDGLTGLLTPRAFRRRLTELIDGRRFVPSARVGLLFVDTDRFKHWNDLFGHAAGDALLRELANVFRAAVSPADLVGRNGGDEFCIVFADAGKADAIERAARLRHRIAALDASALLPPGASAGMTVTASIGVAAYPADATTANDLLEHADAAMYHSKQRGRNAVSYADGTGFTALRDEPG